MRWYMRSTVDAVVQCLCVRFAVLIRLAESRTNVTGQNATGQNLSTGQNASNSGIYFNFILMLFQFVALTCRNRW